MRRGGCADTQDVLKAVAMGAQGVYLGRAFLYGLGAMGEKGVTKSLEIIHKELDTTLALCGLRDIHDVDTRFSGPAPIHWPARRVEPKQRENHAAGCLMTRWARPPEHDLLNTTAEQ